MQVIGEALRSGITQGRVLHGFFVVGVPDRRSPIKAGEDCFPLKHEYIRVIKELPVCIHFIRYCTEIWRCFEV